MNKEISLTKTDDQHRHFPVFVEAERMLEKLAEITKETAARAYKLFLDGGRPDDHLANWMRAEAETLRPAPVTISETPETVNVTVAAPGFKPSEIEISIDGPQLMVSGESESESSSQDENVLYTEWHSDRFFRRLELPAEMEPDNVEPVIENGVLKLTLKKKAQAEAARAAGAGA